MSRVIIHPVLQLVVAIASIAVAIALIIWAGLPDHRDYTGYVDTRLGYVAPEIGSFAPPFAAETLAGSRIQLVEFMGRSVIINFWATWCAPCAIEMPELQAVHEQLGVPVLGVNIAEPPEQMRSWVEEYGLTFHILLDPDLDIYEQYRLVGQPTTFVVAPGGIITHIFYGPTNEEQLQTALSTH